MSPGYVGFMCSTIITAFTFAFAGRLEVAGGLRTGLPAREFVSSDLVAGGAALAVSAEVGTAVHRRFAVLGWRPSLGLDVWSRRWRHVSGHVWSREVGFRVEPRLSARIVLTPHHLYTRWWTVALSVDVGVGAAVALHMNAQSGWGAWSPTLSVRPVAHLGKFGPGFVAMDLRAGIRSRIDDCSVGCTTTLLDPGGTSLGLLVGQTF